MTMLPLGRLEGWMRDHINGFRGPLAAEQFEGGQSNPTYKLLSGAGSYVLRRKPLGHLLHEMHGYTVFLQGTNVVRPGETLLQAVADYVAANSPVGTAVEGRILRR